MKEKRKIKEIKSPEAASNAAGSAKCIGVRKNELKNLIVFRNTIRRLA